MEWFASWFDSPYYHILYKDRDHDEARQLVAQLIDSLGINKPSKVLDLGCGKGRHSLQIASYGHKVLGLDLSKESIAEANLNKAANLRFEVADMRSFEVDEEQDFVFNLFTSFGYFESMEDNLKVLSNISRSLKSNGVLVIDFMNAEKVVKNLVQEEVKVVDNVQFKIKRRVNEGRILKSIKFEDKTITYNFEESVQALTLANFENIFEQTDLKIEGVFGDYALNAFDAKNSDRLILIAKKQ